MGEQPTQPIKRIKSNRRLDWILLVIVVIVIVLIGREYRASRRSAPEDPLAAVKKDIEKHTFVNVLSVKMPKDNVVIEYDLKPRFMWPNEIIHDENVLEIICALRQRGRIEHPHSFRGMGRFRDRYGTLIHRLSVSSVLQASTMNRIGCDKGREASDINWKRLSTYYHSHPIPEGLEVDT